MSPKFVPARDTVGMNSRAFVSYARSDQTYARKLLSFLRDNDVDAWCDLSIDSGARFSQEIQLSLEQSEAFIPVLTPEYMESEWCEAEYLHAQEHHKTILPLLLRGELWLAVRTRQYEDVLTGGMPSDQWLAVLLDLCGHSPNRETTPTPPGDDMKGVGAWTGTRYRDSNLGGLHALDTDKTTWCLGLDSGEIAVALWSGGISVWTKDRFRERKARIRHEGFSMSIAVLAAGMTVEWVRWRKELKKALAPCQLVVSSDWSLRGRSQNTRSTRRAKADLYYKLPYRGEPAHWVADLAQKVFARSVERPTGERQYRQSQL